MAHKKKFTVWLLLPYVLLCLLVACRSETKKIIKQEEPIIEAPVKEEVKKKETKLIDEDKIIQKKNIPDQAYEVANYVYEFNEAPKGFVGGRKFENRENQLPVYGKNKKKINYREFDIYPKVNGKNRGPHRIVLGDNQKRYYTANHYKTFIEF